MKTIYMDNGATSYPKPECVLQAVNDYILNVGASINRSVYEKAQDAGIVTYTLRERLARLFNHNEPKNVVITPGNTYGLNMVIRGYLKPGDHCLVSSAEHNAVMRPLVQLSKTGIEFDRIPCDSAGYIMTDQIEAMIKENTRLVIICHASNVGGAVNDIETIGKICKKHNIEFVVDAAQSAGHYPIDFKAAKLSALSVPGHKGLMGPQGIGALLMTSEFASKLDPIIAGGTGSISDTEEIPEYMPDKFESGTANLPGIYGFEAALHFIEDRGIREFENHEKKLTKHFIDGIHKIQEEINLSSAEIPTENKQRSCSENTSNRNQNITIRIAGPDNIDKRVGVISLDFIGLDNADVSYELETKYGILTRCGMHCAPSAHKTLGTFPQGVVRFTPGYYNTEEDIDSVLNAIREIIKK